MKVSIHTLGCKVNFAEMDGLADQLARAGYMVSEDGDGADVYVVNSCTVTAQADRKVRTLLHGLRRRNPHAHLVLTGCHVDNPHPRLSAMPSADVSFSNVEKPDIFPYLLSAFPPETTGSPQPRAFGRSRLFLKAQDGCDHRCTYCIVWRTRGSSRSEPLADLVSKAQAAVEAGYREIVLTGVDLGAYGRDLGTDLAGLVQTLLAVIHPARLRLSSVNANDFSPTLAGLVGHPGLCPHFHIPLQSGSDAILKRMGRRYRRADYLALVAQLRTQAPELALTTDVIVGFPGETDADFAATHSLAEEAGFTGMHVFRYSPRAGTAAPRLGPPAADPVTRARSRTLQALAAQLRQTYEQRFIGRELEVIWDRSFGSQIRGLTDNYITVFAPRGERAPGQCAHVRALAPARQGLLVA